MDNACYQRIDSITARILDGGDMTIEEAQWMIRLDDDYLSWLMAGADRIRKTYRGNEIEVCAISNVRSGNCSENCSFCSQSGHHQTNSPVYNYISREEPGRQAQHLARSQTGPEPPSRRVNGAPVILAWYRRAGESAQTKSAHS